MFLKKHKNEGREGYLKPLLVPSPLVTRDDRVSPRPTMSTSNRPTQRKTPASSPAEEKVAAGGLPPPPATTSSPKQEMQDALVTAEALAT